MGGSGETQTDTKGSYKMKVTVEIELQDMPPLGVEVNVDDLAGIKKLARAIEASAKQVTRTWPKLAKRRIVAVRIKCEGKARRPAAHAESAAA